MTEGSPERSAAVFSAVEIDFSSCRPLGTTLDESWAAPVPGRFQLTAITPNAIRHRWIAKDAICISMQSRKLEMQTLHQVFFTDDVTFLVEAYSLCRKSLICTEPMQFPDIVSTS